MLIGACASGDTDSRYEGIAVPETRLGQVPQFVLTDTSGNDFDLANDTEGQVRLIYQMFTNCPDICGVQLAQLSSVLRRPGAPKNVQVLAVTVDAERDTPEVLRAYLDQFSSDFVGLIPDDDQHLTDLQNALGALASIKIFPTTTTVHMSMDATDMDPSDTDDNDMHGGDMHGGEMDTDRTMTAMDHGEVDYDIAHDARVFAYAPNGFGYVQYPHPTRQSQFDHDLPILAGISPDDPAGAGL